MDLLNQTRGINHHSFKRESEYTPGKALPQKRSSTCPTISYTWISIAKP